MLSNELASRINYVLEKRGLKQADLARMSGLSTAVISQLCSGKTKNPTFDSVIKVSDALGLPLDYFAGRMPKK